jgi:hypothetical protein
MRPNNGRPSNLAGLFTGDCAYRHWHCTHYKPIRENTMKHTHIPWETSVNSDGQWDICETNAGDMIADLSGTSNQEEHACLIAAAPELLSALKNCLNLIEGESLDELHGDLAEVVRDAIAKAEGTNG